MRKNYRTIPIPSLPTNIISVWSLPTLRGIRSNLQPGSPAFISATTQVFLITTTIYSKKEYIPGYKHWIPYTFQAMPIRFITISPDSETNSFKKQSAFLKIPFPLP